jgi:hypothetical protein
VLQPADLKRLTWKQAEVEPRLTAQGPPTGGQERNSSSE